VRKTDCDASDRHKYQHHRGGLCRVPEMFKLTDHQKREAIKRRNQGETLADIARSYNVSPATISRLCP